jgi:hypothetical protein
MGWGGQGWTLVHMCGEVLKCVDMCWPVMARVRISAKCGGCGMGGHECVEMSCVARCVDLVGVGGVTGVVGVAGVVWFSMSRHVMAGVAGVGRCSRHGRGGRDG